MLGPLYNKDLYIEDEEWDDFPEKF